MDNPGSEQVLFSNSRILVGVVLLLSGAAFFLALCMAILVLTFLFPLAGFTFGRLVNAFCWGLAAFVFGTLGLAMGRLGLRMAFYEVLLDARGAAFRLGTRRQPATTLFPWDQITAVRHKRLGNAQYYAVRGRDGSSVEFSSYTFFRPKKVARSIADRAGQAIQEL